MHMGFLFPGMTGYKYFYNSQLFRLFHQMPRKKLSIQQKAGFIFSHAAALATSKKEQRIVPGS